MSIIEFEIEEIQKLCENVVPNSKIITCTAVDPLIRVKINENQYNRQLTVCLRFPATNYPKEIILIELKSRNLSESFLDALTTLCEKQVREKLGKPQGLHVLRFIQSYINDNPLCVCYDEIQQLRHELGSSAIAEQLKLKQRSSTIYFTAKGGEYFYRIKGGVPKEYPQKCVDLHLIETNLPDVLQRYLIGQSREIARQCVEPPIRSTKDELAKFQPSPSLFKALKFCLKATRDFHTEQCPICDKSVLPKKPTDIVRDDTNDLFVERVFCGHLFHQGCLKKYLQEPPFTPGGKLCPAKKQHPRSDTRYYVGSGLTGVANGKKGANSSKSAKRAHQGDTCGIRLAHDRWVVNIKVAESRWAQKQARQRELEEVIDFLK